MHGVLKSFWLLTATLLGLAKVIFVSYIPNRVTTNTQFFHGYDPAHCKQYNNYCTPFATISQNADRKHQVNCSNIGTIGKHTIWRTRMCLETGYSTLHQLTKSRNMAIFGLKRTNPCALQLTLACTIYLCAVSNQILVQQLLQRNCWKFQLNYFTICKMAQSYTVHHQSALCGPHMNLLMPKAARGRQ